MKNKNMFSIRIGEKTIKIISNYSYVKEYCEKYLTDQAEDMLIEISQNDILQEQQRSEAEDIKEGNPIRNFTDEYLEVLAVYRKIAEKMIEYDTLLFHGSVISVDGVGYLFTAKSGTGKSTHTRLWHEVFGDRVVMVNDDKPLLRITEEGVTVFGTPWDGKHRLSNNIAVPLKAICVLNRDKTNHICPVSRKEVYPLLLQQTYRSVEPLKMAKTLQLLDGVIRTTNLYALGCNMEREAAVVAYTGINKEDDL